MGKGRAGGQGEEGQEIQEGQEGGRFDPTDDAYAAANWRYDRWHYGRYDRWYYGWHDNANQIRHD